MKQPNRILIFQTAFLGDVILTLPLVQVLHRHFPDAQIDFLATPRGAEILRNHPAIHDIIEYDKRGKQRGLSGIFSMFRFLKSRQDDVALVPHRSLRSALVAAGIPNRVGFNTSAGRILFTKLIMYSKDVHEIDRNLAFVKIFGITPPRKELPSLYPSEKDVTIVDQFLSENKIARNDKLLAVAPGSVWNTKRWRAEGFADLSMRISGAGWKVVLVGGQEDEKLCREIRDAAKGGRVYIAAGALTVLQSAELLRRCNALVTNDSAPLHLATAMRTRVVAIFGATVPSFGFGPCGERDAVVETAGLACRPCTIHGGDDCPIGTFECMVKITAEMVFEKVMNAREGEKRDNVPRYPTS